MNKKKLKHENILNDDIYEKKNFPLGPIVIAALILIPLGFMFNFPIKNIIRDQMISALSSNRDCPILFNDVEVSYFLPKVIIKSPTITKQCIRSLEDNLNIEDIVIRPHLPSFKLPGIRLSVLLKKGNTSIYFYPVIGLNKFALSISNSIIHSDFISYFTNGLDIISGTFSLSLNANIKNNQFKNANFKLESKDLYIKSTNINNFIIPQINLQHFSLRAKINSKLELEIAPGNLIIGNKSSPIYTGLGGSLKINKRNFASSKINIDGEMVLTSKFLDIFPIIRLKIQSPSSNGNYRFSANGTLSNPETYKFN